MRRTPRCRWRCPARRQELPIARTGDAWNPIPEDAPRALTRTGELKGLRLLKTLRVLVADDHRLMLAAVRRALSDAHDFEIVSEVSVGSHVLPAVRETSPDVVLLDLRMPEFDGLGCLERLQKHDPDVAVVILSSYSDPEQIEAGSARRCPRLCRQDGRARRPGDGAPHCALGHDLRGLGRRRSRAGSERPPTKRPR